MTKEEMKNKISMALKDPVLQQGFEIICKENAELQEENKSLKNRNAELKGMYAHSTREAGTYKQFLELKEKENVELKEQNINFQSWFKENTPKEGLSETTTFSKQFVRDAWDNGYYVGYNKAKEEMIQNGLALQSDMDKTIEQNIALKKQIEKMKCWYNMDYSDKESCKKIPQGIQLLTEYDCGLFVAYCVNRWTGDHWEEHSYGITRWKEIEEND